MAWQAQRLDKSSICRLLGINWRTVGTIIERLVEERLSPNRLEGLQVIGVDELAWRAGHKYVSLVVEHLRSRVVWVGEGKSEETLDAFFDMTFCQRRGLGECRLTALCESGTHRALFMVREE